MSASKATIADVFSQSCMDKLDSLARGAWQKHPGKDAGAARRDHIAAALRLELTFGLIENYQPQIMPQAIGWLLNRAKDGAKQNTSITLVGGGHCKPDTRGVVAPVTQSRDGASGRRSEPATQIATPIVDAPAAPLTEAQIAKIAKQAELKVLSDKQAARTLNSVKTEIRLSRLDTVMVFGKPIGNCTVAQVKDWIVLRQTDQREAGRDVLFASNLVANLPSGAVIREWWKSGDEVDAVYAKAEADHAV